MKHRRLTLLTAAIASLAVATLSCSGNENADGQPSAVAGAPDARAASPAFGHYDQTVGRDLWTRPGLSARDRSMVTVAAVVAREQSASISEEVGRALDNGVTPTEISELVAHLGFYASWPTAQNAIAAIGPVFAERGIDTADLPAGDIDPLPLDDEAEESRLRSINPNFQTTAPGVLQQTTDVLFRDLWLRPGLAPRDRSLVTVSALIASGQPEQITYHLNRAMASGLTEPEVSEALVQLAYYSGWPKVFSALPVVDQVFAQRR